MARSIPALALLACLAGCGQPDPAPAPAAAAPAPTQAKVATQPVPPTDATPPADDESPADAGAPRPQAAPLPIGRPLLIEFSRDSCLPCKLMEPWLAELKREHAGVVEVIEVDLDEPDSAELGRFFKARSVPLQVYVAADGREVARNVGLATLEQMRQRLERLGFLAKR